MSRMGKIISFLDEIFAGLVLGLIILLTIAGVLFRYLLNQPIAWQEEISTVLMVWFVFMGCSVVAKHKSHICINTSTERLASTMSTSVSSPFSICPSPP